MGSDLIKVAIKIKYLTALTVGSMLDYDPLNFSTIICKLFLSRKSKNIWLPIGFIKNTYDTRARLLKVSSRRVRGDFFCTFSFWS